MKHQQQKEMGKIIVPVKWSDRGDFEKTKEQLAYFENVFF
jgi:hypothetical protein